MLVLTCGLLLPASPRGGTLKGAVLSGKGVPVKSAQVYWESADGTNPHILHTGSNGAFQIMVQRDGLYDLRAESGGMWSEWKRNVIVRGGADVNIDLRLSRSQPPASSRAAGRDADNGKSRE
jgi:hypothetical protein